MNQQNTDRKSIRLRDYDYATPGAYMVTICTWNHRCIFGEIRDGQMHLNGLGSLVSERWQATPGHYGYVRLDEYIVMPNHLHGLLIIETSPDFPGEAGLAPTKRLSLGAIVGSFKSSVTRRARKTCGFNGKHLWQRNYYEHVVRNEIDLANIRQYIVNNPARWEFDKENSEGGD
jgi:REP-associated tyrosine transposase